MTLFYLILFYYFRSDSTELMNGSEKENEKNENTPAKKRKSKK
jgi:hypothetical protein